MDLVVNRLLTPSDASKRVVLAYGNGDWSERGMKGLPPGPLNTIKDHIMRKHGEVLVIIDEYRTSKTCSRCLQGPLAEVFCHNSKGWTVSTWGLKRCSMACGELRSRDKNAAENMALLLAHRRAGGEGRPGYLARGG